MSNDTNKLWSLFINGLNSTGINIPPDTFKMASGLKVADWQLIDYNGLMPDHDAEINVKNLFNTCDPMPEWNKLSYIIGKNFHDQYGAFLYALEDNNTDYILTKAKSRLDQYNMIDGNGSLWPEYTISPSLHDFYINCLNDSDKPPKIHFEVNFDLNSKRQAEMSFTSKSVNSPLALPAFINLKNKNKTLERSLDRSTQEDTELQDLTFEFTAQNAEVFSISPSRWFNSAMITNYYDKIDKDSALFGKDIFGENGVLNLRVTKVLVAYKRKVTITGSSEQLAKLHDPDYMKDSENSVGIGSFSFEGGTSTEFSSKKNSYTYIDSSNAPYILGFQVAILG